MCDVYKDLQGINRPSDDENYLEYSKIIYETIFNSLRNSITPEMAINTIKKYTNVKYINVSKPITITMIGCTIICQGLMFIIAYNLIKYRKLKCIYKSNLVSLIALLIGLLFYSSTVYYFIGDLKENKCSITLWIMNLSMIFITSILLIRSLRICIILNYCRIKFVNILIKKKVLIFIFVSIIIIIVLLLSLAQIIDPIERKTRIIRLDDIEIERFYVCENKNKYSLIIYGIIAIISFIINLSGWYISKKIKSVALNFYESINIDKPFIGFLLTYIILILSQFTYISNIYLLFCLKTLIILANTIYVTIIIYYQKISSVYLYIKNQKKKKKRVILKINNNSRSNINFINAEIRSDNYLSKNQNYINRSIINSTVINMNGIVADTTSSIISCFSNYAEDTTNILKGIIYAKHSTTINELVKRNFFQCEIELIKDVKFMAIRTIQNTYTAENKMASEFSINKKKIVSLLNMALCKEYNMKNNHNIRFTIQGSLWFELLFENDEEYKHWNETLQNIEKQNISSIYEMNDESETKEDYSQYILNNDNAISEILNEYNYYYYYNIEDNNNENQKNDGNNNDINNNDNNNNNKTIKIKNTNISTSFYINKDVNNLYKETKKKLNITFDNLQMKNNDNNSKQSYILSHLLVH
ncbi:hypothetical protein BCR36DRAFT_164450 [Piromyces finnis]|uniref:G-protein coupled receptors family 3 profile domain-containing protein n=1 Tax=Piromyces finnis TaxID=1754191 RepID=A0A1Y1VIW3_9FUNG|nr:hypothetical protein BCR36DRAFT_164450 [Piromyces finnis]|eukprot:ORX56618.1 hypothetical protein BCR36DRAFT_164450 [Piromyces finnis]